MFFNILICSCRKQGVDDDLYQNNISHLEATHISENSTQLSIENNFDSEMSYKLNDLTIPISNFNYIWEPYIDPLREKDGSYYEWIVARNSWDLFTIISRETLFCKKIDFNKYLIEGIKHEGSYIHHTLPLPISWSEGLVMLGPRELVAGFASSSYATIDIIGALNISGIAHLIRDAHIVCVSFF